MAKDDRYAQVSVSEGIKRHDKNAIMTVIKEYAQLNDNAVGPVVIPQLIK